MQKSPMQQLVDGDLPKMVRWYDPRLLARIGVRTLVSAVFGQYADQRLVQAATDPSSGRELVFRHDYSDFDSVDLNRRVACDADGCFWVDYISDIGDGFEATYATAYLLAQDGIELKGVGTLPHGDLLIMGGDQCYPQATRPEYKKRLQSPYEIALSGNERKRKLFAIPGNHDWYDGLQAFDSLFCSSRDKLSESRGTLIGGWQCQQHRSYWALKLPHNWWIWGTDIQFSKYLDTAQVNYFISVASQMGPSDKLIICMAEPAWLLADFQGQDEEENFFKITAIARSRGIKICAVLAGDWHHYNRYSSIDLGVHFFTAGGGGAFLHPTHVLKNEVSVRWPEIRATSFNENDQGSVRHEWAAQRYDVRLKRPVKPGSAMQEAVREVVEPIKEMHQEIKQEIKATVKPAANRAPLKPRAPKCYPSKSRSLLLSLRNLAFPLFNFPFAIGIGIIYWLITWQFHTVVRAYDISAGKIDEVGLTMAPTALLRWLPLYMLQATLSMSFAIMLIGLLAVLIWYVDAEQKPGLRRAFTKAAVGSAHYLAHLVAMFALFVMFLALNNAISPWFTEQANAFLARSSKDAGVLETVVKESLEPLTQERQRLRELRDVGPRDPSPPPAAQPTRAAKTVAPQTVREIVGLLYPFEMMLVGGLVGGFIWGCYWVIAGLFGHMHAEDAFAALRIKNYRNFLRMKFEPDQVTIYPVGLKRVPGLSDWTASNGETYKSGGKSGLVPSKPLSPHLIEEPIIIRPAQTKA